MSSAGPRATIAIGPVLRDALVLVLRHWLMLLVAWVALAELGLLILSQLTRCYEPGGSCLAAALDFFGDDSSQWIISSLLNELAAFLVLAVALYFLYSSKRSGMVGTAYLRSSTARGMRFLGRVGLTWILILLPVWLVDLSLSWLAEAVPALAQSEAVRWIVYVLRIVLLSSIGAFAHARLSLYLPSVAFSLTPRGLVDSWRGTRSAATRLFGMFLLVGLVTAAFQTAILFLAHSSSIFVIAVELVAKLLGLRSNLVLHRLAPLAAYILTVVPQVLITAAASLIVFRRLVSHEDQTELEVFG